MATGKINKLDPIIETATLTTKNGFAVSSGQAAISVKKYGKVVHLSGTITPTKDIASSSEATMIATMPSAYRPPRNLYILCQGSGYCKWLLTVYADGDLGFSRYSDGTGGITATTGVWLPFSVTWIVN